MALKFRKWMRNTLLILGVLLLLSVVLWFVFRNQILNYAWNKASTKLEKKGYQLQCKSKSFTGFSSIHFSDIKLDYANDSFISAQKVSVSIHLWKSLWNGLTFSELNLDKTHIQLIKTDTFCNFCALQSSQNKKEEKEPNDPLVQRLFDFIKRTVSKIPSELTLNQFHLSYTDSAGISGVSIPNLIYKGKKIDGIFKISDNNNLTAFGIKGIFDRNDLTGKLSVTPQNKKWVELPGLRNRLGIAAGFELADFELEKLDMSRGVLDITADGHFKGVTIDDRRIADTTIIVRECSGKLVAHLGTDFLEIDSATSLNLNKISTHLFARADLGKNKAYTLKFMANKIKANDFFNSLPEGMFSSVKGLEATGELAYKLYVHIEDKNPMGAILQSELTPYGFKITRMGQTDLRKMNGSFSHTFYERGKPVRTFTVGPSNPAFTPLDQIPEMLKNAVMTGEDPVFYQHNGFYQDAFRSSLAQNYIQKRFARGGSTISMQLVKNVFLSRKKTLARKAEEILIVWLVESQRLTSKARMFEVYLNVIEWGPGVFGVGEAAPFYFNKPAAALEPLECAFLASIVPSPKKYRYFLDSTGNVSDRNWNFVAIRNRMIQRGMLDPSDSASFNVKITGPAGNYLEREIIKNEDDLGDAELLED